MKSMRKLIVTGGLLAAGALLWIPACTRDLATPGMAPSNNPTVLPTYTAAPPTATATMAAPTPTATPTCVSTTTPALIDDMEDDDNQILANECRGGTWFAYSDTAGSSITPAQGASFVMASPGYTGAGYAAEITGSLIPSNAGNNYAGFGGLGFNFLLAADSFYAIPPGYTGFTFYGKLGAASQVTGINAAITDYDTAGTAQGGLGLAGPFATAETLTTTWTRYSVTMSGPNWKNAYGGPTTFLPSQAQALQFQLAPSSSVTQSFDLWIDQVSFF